VVIFGLQNSARYPDAESVPETLLINPVITSWSLEEAWGWEGCLSVPGLRGEMASYASIRCQGLDEHGQPIDRPVAGCHARVVQHECDPLGGTRFPMRVRDFTRFGLTDVLFPGRGGSSSR
jgi:peptide deformylase